MPTVYLNYPGEQNSVGETLHKTFGAKLRTINLGIDPEHTEEAISSNLQGAKLIIGSGVGGFWANYAAQKTNTPCILVNPNINPSDYLSRQVGRDPQGITAWQVVGYINREYELSKKLNHELVSLVLSDKDFEKTMDYFSSALLGYISITNDLKEAGLVSKVAEMVEYLTH